MSYQLRISILYTGMQINNQTALSRAFAFFLIVFLPVDLFLANPRPSWRKSPFPSPRLPPPPLVMAVKRQTCSYIMVTSDWEVELKRRSNRRRCSRLTLSPRLCAKEVPPFWLRRFLHWETGAIFFPCAAFFSCTCTTFWEKYFSYKVTRWYVCQWTIMKTVPLR